MGKDYEERLTKPLINAAYPGALASLSLAVLQMVKETGHLILIILLSLDAILFIVCAFFLFFYTIYPWKKRLWTVSAITFLSGLILSLSAVISLVIA